MSQTDHAVLGQLAEKFAQLPDPRDQRQPRHLLGDLLVIALCSMLTGGRTFADMEDYGEGHAEWLRTFLLLPNGIPSHDTFNRVFAALDSHALEGALRQWGSQCEAPHWDMTLPEHPNALRQLAVDGKRLRGSRRTEECSGRSTTKMDQTLNVWCVQHGLTLAQRRIPPDGSEIEQMPLLLRHLHLQGAVVTADAAHAQTHTAQVIIERGGEYVLCVKGNQPATLAALEQALKPLSAAVVRPHFESIGKGHGRLETRRCWVLAELADFAPRGQWKGLGSIGVIESVREELGTGKVSTERRYYISSLGALSTEQATAQRLAGIVRSHWGVEALHWRLDVQWGEDQCRARAGKAATNLSGLRKLAINLLCAVPPPVRTAATVSMRRRHYIATINPNYLTALLAHFAS
ncbi:ISAs1 family transposase [Dokdonella sp.]|jgi:predicted transposase YbfD/YdcC|uniref:ISAs1 family transposase n=1 Tax=Dokdonella sp. TaxID=2291710 RepID=UPI002DD69637|nr:ISAs1 family transposase [Dokdonella sp.]